MLLRVLASGGGGTASGNGLIVRLLSIPLRWLGLAVGGLVLGISGLFGGLDDVGDPNVDTIDFEQTVPGSPFNVTIHSVRVADEAPRIKHAEAGTRWIIVEATLENTDTETNLLASRALRIGGVDGVKKPGADEDIEELPDRVLLVRDGGLASQVMPGLPIRVGFFWEQSASAPVPTTVEVIVMNMTKRPQAADQQVWWFDAKPVASLRTPVNYTRNASPSPTLPSATGSVSARPTTSARPATPTPTATPTATPSPTRSR
jgi:hypothetical protein